MPCYAFSIYLTDTGVYRKVKLTPIEKKMLAAVVALFVVGIISIAVLTMSLNKMLEDGGLKGAVNELWHGKASPESINR